MDPRTQILREGRQYAVDGVSVTTDDFNNDRVYDSRGKYLGTLIGTNDAQVIIDAISDRNSGAGIIIPDPGFSLDWEQEVSLPANEDDFTIQTVGTPELDISSGFSGDYAVKKPATSNGPPNYLSIDSLHINDGSNGVLTAGIYASDFRRSIINRPIVENAPGIVIGAANSYTQDNMIFNPHISQYGTSAAQANNGTGIELTEPSDSATVDQNWIVCPRFSDGNHDTETAFIDRGKHNMWLFPRVEHAQDCILFDGTQDSAAGRNYKLYVGNFDRTQNFDKTIIEKGDAYGTIKGLNGPNGFAKMRLLSPNTDLNHVASPPHSNREIGAVNILEDLRKVTPARTLASMGLRDNSTNGSVTLGSSFNEHTQVDWSTGASSGNTAVLDLGGSSAMKPAACPKCSVHWQPVTTGGGSDDDDDVLVRMGLYRNSNNYAELIYDPTDHLSTSVANTSNWNLRVENGGTIQDTVDLGVGPSDDERLTLLRELDSDENASWFGAVDMTNTGSVSEGGSNLGESNWRWYVETRTNVDKQWRMLGSWGHSLWRM